MEDLLEFSIMEGLETEDAVYAKPCHFFYEYHLQLPGYFLNAAKR